MGLIDDISAELARLRRENDALRADLASVRSVYYFAALEAKIAELRAALERHEIAITREARENLFSGDELGAASKLGEAICDYIERCRTGLRLEGGIRAGVDAIIRKDALPWLSQRPKIIAAQAIEQKVVEK